MDRELDVVLIALQGVVVYDDLGFLSSLGIAGGKHHRACLKRFKALPLHVKLPGQHGILLQAGHRPGFFKGGAGDRGQMLQEGSRLLAKEHFQQSLTGSLRGFLGCALGAQARAGQN